MFLRNDKSCHVQHDMGHYPSWIFNNVVQSTNSVGFHNVNSPLGDLDSALQPAWCFSHDLIIGYLAIDRLEWKLFNALPAPVHLCAHFVCSGCRVFSLFMDSFPSSPFRFLHQNPICNLNEVKKVDRISNGYCGSSGIMTQFALDISVHFSLLCCLLSHNRRVWNNSLHKAQLLHLSLLSKRQLWKIFKSFSRVRLMEHITSVSPVSLSPSIPKEILPRNPKG